MLCLRRALSNQWSSASGTVQKVFESPTEIPRPGVKGKGLPRIVGIRLQRTARAKSGSALGLGFAERQFIHLRSLTDCSCKRQGPLVPVLAGGDTWL